MDASSFDSSSCFAGLHHVKVGFAVGEDAGNHSLNQKFLVRIPVVIYHRRHRPEKVIIVVQIHNGAGRHSIKWIDGLRAVDLRGCGLDAVMFFKYAASFRWDVFTSAS